MPQGCGGRSVIGDLATEVELHISLFQICFIDNSVQKHQLARIGAGKAARPGMSAWTSVLKTFGALAALAFQRRRAWRLCRRSRCIERGDFVQGRHNGLICNIGNVTNFRTGTVLMNLTRRDFATTSLGLLGSLAFSSSLGAAELENHRIVLASRPVGKPTVDNFRLETVAVPNPGEGQALLKTLYLSLDPYMRGRMSAGDSYADNVGLNEVMVGGTVSRVMQSSNPKLPEGTLVSAYSGWQEYAVTDGSGVTLLDPRIQPPSYGLGVLGMPGLTAYVGLLDIGQPRAGETVVLAASTGAVGSVVGQIAKLKGCRVVGIAGAREKCEYAVKELGYDACISHYDDDMAQQLAAACPDGIDVYFENVGGSSWEAVMPLLNQFARVPVCGLIAHYNQAGLPPGPDRMVQMQRLILVRRIKMQGFIVSDHQDRIPDFVRDVSSWLAEGKIKYREHVVEGLENAPEAFLGLFKGANFGKLVLKVGS
jgi:NADPH-dependent curcumin reductase CurA